MKKILLILLLGLLVPLAQGRHRSQIDDTRRACFISSTDPDFPKKDLCTDTCQNMCQKRTDGFTSHFTKSDYEIHDRKEYPLEICFCLAPPAPVPAPVPV